MARKAPTGIHSEFRARMAVTVRAPEGDSMRALQMQRLVQEMAERHASGHLIEWMTSALLDKVAREMAFEQGINIPNPRSQWSGAASQPREGRGVEQSQTVERVLPAVQAAEHDDGVDRLVAATTATPKTMPSGLKRAM